MITHSNNAYKILLVYGDHFCSIQIDKALVNNARNLGYLENVCRVEFRRMINKNNISARLGYYLGRFWCKCKGFTGPTNRNMTANAGEELLEAIDEDQST